MINKLEKQICKQASEMNKMQSGKQGWLGHYLNCRAGRCPEWQQCMLPVRLTKHLAPVRAAIELSRRCEWCLGLSPGRLATEVHIVLPDSDFHGRKQAS